VENVPFAKALSADPASSPPSLLESFTPSTELLESLIPRPALAASSIVSGIAAVSTYLQGEDSILNTSEAEEGEEELGARISDRVSEGVSISQWHGYSQRQDSGEESESEKSLPVPRVLASSLTAPWQNLLRPENPPRQPLPEIPSRVENLFYKIYLDNPYHRIIHADI